MSDSKQDLSSLLLHYNLTEGDCDQQVSAVHLEEISRSHCKHWRKLPAHLDLPEIVASDIDHKQVEESEKRQIFFADWKERKGSDATYKSLISALLKINCRQDAESICKQLQESMMMSTSHQLPVPLSVSGQAAPLQAPTPSLSHVDAEYINPPVCKKRRTESGEVPVTPDVEAYLRRLPPDALTHLHKLLDEDHEGVDKDLNEIAHHMVNWEVNVSFLELTQIDTSDIKQKYSTEPELQRQAALRKWKEKKGLGGTYLNLLKVFVEAPECTDCANALCNVLKRKCTDSQDCCKKVRFSSTSSCSSHDDVERDFANQGRRGSCPSSVVASQTRRVDTGVDNPSQQRNGANQWSSKRSRSCSSTKNDNGSDFKLDQLTAIDLIKDVLRWKNLGIHLGLTSAKISQIEEFPEEQQKSNLIKAWFECDEPPSLDKLYTALRKLSVGEIRVAERVDSFRKASLAGTSGSSFDDSAFESESEQLLQTQTSFTEDRVLEAIAKITNHDDLGRRLGIEQHDLSEILKQPIQHQKQKLVATFFRTVSKQCLNWMWVDKAIKDTEIGEKAERSTSLAATATSDDVNAFSILVNKSTKMIRTEHFKLKQSIIKNLKEVDVDIDVFRDYVQELFDAGDSLTAADDIAKIFKILTDKKYWSFLDVSGLESIVEVFSAHLEEENEQLISIYQENLNGYLATTKIKDYMSDRSDEENGSQASLSKAESEKRYDEKYRTDLSVKLLGKKNPSVNISLQSLEYIKIVWKKLGKAFNMPSLPHVLDKIVKGCVVVHWIVCHDFTRKILEEITSANVMELFERESIGNLHLENVCVYDQETGVANQKVLSYIKLLLLAQEDKTDEAKAMIKEYLPEIDTPMDDAEKTALLFAAHHGHQKITHLLLDCGANMYICDKAGGSVLSLSKAHPDLHWWLQNKTEDKLIAAAKENELEPVKNSLNIGVDPNAKEKDEYAWTPLLWACEKGYREIVYYLLEHGAEVDAKDKNDWTGLILSSRRGFLEIVMKLLDKGANVNQLTNVRWSSLLWTAQEGHAEVAKLLLERGADPTIPDKAGFTPLIQASQDGKLGVIKALVEKIPNAKDELDVKTKAQWSAIMVASKNGHKDVVEYLTENEFDIHYAKEDEVTALHIASFKGRNDVVRYMCLKAKMEVDAQDCDGVTPLMFATRQGDLTVVRTLVENGHADVNVQENDSEWTAPFFALEGIQNKDLEVLKYLLRSGRVDITHKDKNGNTIVDIARTIRPSALKILEDNPNYRDQTVKMLRESEAKPLVDVKQIYWRLFNKMDKIKTAENDAQQQRKEVTASA